jgi:hemerythrin-like domain-containing protein
MNELFSRRYDVGPEMLLDFLQQALTAMPTVASSRLVDGGDRIEFTTSLTLTSWGNNMVAAVDPDERGGAVLRVSGEPRVGLMSTPWGEEMHAATIETQLFAALDPAIQVARTNPIMMLQADHRRVEALFARIQVTDDGERAELVQQLLAALQVHMELEETHVYPLLQQEVDSDLAEEAEVEHQLARDGLAQLEELAPDEPGFDAALAMVMAGIEHHVGEEESEAFPRLAQQLGGERLAELAEQLTTARGELLEQARTGKPTTSSAAKQSPRPARPKRGSDRPRTPSSRRARAKVDPDEMTKADLVQRAKKAGISGYSHMTKAELAKAISAAK